MFVDMIEGSLEVKFPTIWTDGKAEVGGVRQKWEEQRKERARRKTIQVREKVGKSRFTAFFQWFVALGGRKVGSPKRRVRSHLARWEMKNCTLLWSEAHFEVKMYKAHQLRSTFRSWAVEKCALLCREANFQSRKSKAYGFFPRATSVRGLCPWSHFTKFRVQWPKRPV